MNRRDLVRWTLSLLYLGVAAALCWLYASRNWETSLRFCREAYRIFIAR